MVMKFVAADQQLIGEPPQAASAQNGHDEAAGMAEHVGYGWHWISVGTKTVTRYFSNHPLIRSTPSPWRAGQIVGEIQARGDCFVPYPQTAWIWLSRGKKLADRATPGEP